MTFENLLKQKKVYVVMLTLALWIGCSPSPSFALPVGSYEQEGSYHTNREIIDTFLAQELVSEKLAKMGLSKSEINSRLDKLSPEQMHTLAMRLDRIKSGGSGWVIALVVVLVLIGMVFFFLTHTLHIEPKEPVAE